MSKDYKMGRKLYTVKLERDIEADNREDALMQFWEMVDDAENEDIKVTQVAQ